MQPWEGFGLAASSHFQVPAAGSSLCIPAQQELAFVLIRKDKRSFWQFSVPWITDLLYKYGAYLFITGPEQVCMDFSTAQVFYFF